MIPPTLVRLVLALTAALTSAAPSAAATPNILFVLIDDLGWMDLRCQGNLHLDTPNIDHFAGQGMRFTDAYAPAPCARRPAPRS